MRPTVLNLFTRTRISRLMVAAGAFTYVFLLALQAASAATLSQGRGGALPAPVLLTPADGAGGVVPRPGFAWEPVDGVAGPLPGFVSLDVPGGQATHVSPDGRMVVGTFGAGGGGWVWCADSGAVTLPSSTNAVALAGTGFPALGDATNSATGETEAAVWTSIDDTEPELLGGLAGGQNLDGTLSTAYGMNPDASVVVGLAYNADLEAEAFRWTADTGMQALPKLNADRAARANGVSTDGNIVWGWNDTETGFRRAVRWVDGEIEQLVDAEGNQIGEATGANRDAGVIVGSGLGIAGQEIHAWRWTVESGAVSIGDLAAGPLENNFAFAASHDGSVIVGATGFGPFRQATIWTENGELRWLTDELAALDIEVPAGWDINTATAISADGDIIAGWGSDGTNLNSFLINLDAGGGTGGAYRIQVATDAGFEEVILDETVTGESYTPAVELPPGEYYWRVQGINGCGRNTWSEAFSFTTQGTVQGGPVSVPALGRAGLILLGLLLALVAGVVIQRRMHRAG